MRSLSLSAAAVAGILGLASVSSATVYSGNGASGFGGPIGNGTLTVTDGGSTVNFSLATSGFNGNGLAIYLDTVTGGFADTTSFTDNADGGRTVLSGNGGSNGRSNVTFAPGFTADYGISVEPGSFAGIFNLTQTNGFFSYVGSAGLDTTATTLINFSVNKADVGLPTTGTYSFNFEASLISTSAYRANETIGTSVTTLDPLNLGTAPNAGFTGSQVFATANTFTTATPEPTSLALMGLGALAGLRRRRA